MYMDVLLLFFTHIFSIYLPQYIFTSDQNICVMCFACILLVPCIWTFNFFSQGRDAVVEVILSPLRIGQVNKTNIYILILTVSQVLIIW